MSVLRRAVCGGAGLATAYGVYRVAVEPAVDENELTRHWDPASTERYWKERPVAASTRAAQVAAELVPLTCGCAWDHLRGTLDDERLRHHARGLRGALTRLGPACVKLGQALSIRPDVLPAAALGELRSLCDAVEPIPTAVAFEAIERELGLPASAVFTDLTATTEPIAAASLGQVYRCTTRGGRTVAVKVQRPGIIASVSLDLHLLRSWSHVVEFAKSLVSKNARAYDVALVDAFARGAWGELDYEVEAAHQRRMRDALRRAKSQRLREDVYIPDVLAHLTTRRVLTTAWVDGDQLCRASPSEIQRLVPLGIELFIWQLLDEGHFHCDPHPGNLLVNSHGQLVLIDFGLCAEIARPDALAMTTAVVHLIEGNVPELLEDAIALDFLPPNVDRGPLLRVLQKVFDEAKLAADLGPSSSSSSSSTRCAAVKRRRKNFVAVSEDLNDVFFNHPFSVPDYFALITRSLVILEGIALTGDPNFDLFNAAYPHAWRRAHDIFGTDGLRRITSAAATNVHNQLFPSPGTTAPGRWSRTTTTTTTTTSTTSDPPAGEDAEFSKKGKRRTMGWAFFERGDQVHEKKNK